MFPCNHCDKRYVRHTSLYAHCISRHGVKYSAKTVSPVQDNRIKINVVPKVDELDDASFEDLLAGKVTIKSVTEQYASAIASKLALFFRPMPTVYLNLDDCTDNNIIKHLSITKDGVNQLSLIEDLCIACKYAEVFTMVFTDQIGYNEDTNRMQYFDGKQVVSIEPTIGVLYNIYSTLINKIATTNCRPMKLVSENCIYDVSDNLIMQENMQVSDRFHAVMYSISEPYTTDKIPKNKKVLVGTILLSALQQPVFNVRFNSV